MDDSPKQATIRRLRPRRGYSVITMRRSPLARSLQRYVWIGRRLMVALARLS